MMIKDTDSRFLWKTLFLAISIIFFSGLAIQAQTCPFNFTTSGTITTNDPTEARRVARNGVASDCNGKPYPGAIAPGATPYHYDAYTVGQNNSSTAACVQVTLNASAGIHSVAYLESFNPNSIQTNYLGDLGVGNSANTNQSYSFSVPPNANLVIVVNETTSNAGGTYTLTVGCTTPPPPAAFPGQVIISEFRLSGPGASGNGSINDEYIEFYNDTDIALSLAGYGILAYDPNFQGGSNFMDVFPAGTSIPARGHFLYANISPGTAADSYSLASSAPPDYNVHFSTGQTPNVDDSFVDNEGFQLIDPSNNVIDSVGFEGAGGRPGEVTDFREGTGLRRRAAAPPTVQYAYVRRFDTGTGRPIDTNNNFNDFILVSTTGSPLASSTGGTIPVVLGAPGPQNVSSPTIKTNAQIIPSLIEPTTASSAPPNRVRDATPGTDPPTKFGTLAIRRSFTNNTGGTITRLRFRVVDITTLGSTGGGAGSGQADMRVVTSNDSSIPTTTVGVATVQGTQIEQPPAQSNGGGLNSSLNVALPATGLSTTSGGVCLAGSTCSVNVQFLLGVQQSGRFRFFIYQEALP
jgi:hypothetical protein